MMHESDFLEIVEAALQALLMQIESQLGDEVDADLNDGVLTIEFEDGRHYVINRHLPNQQIWLSSPISGPAHFDYNPVTKAWDPTRDQTDSLGGVLKNELGLHSSTFNL